MRIALAVSILALATASAAVGQGVPIIDGSRLANSISRIAEMARDFGLQTQMEGDRTRLSEIEEEQLEAYERFLAASTGTTDFSSFEAGSASFPSTADTYPVEENHPDAQRLFGDGASVEQMIITTAARYQNHPGVQRVGLNPTTWRILFQSMIKQESRFNNAAVSSAGAMGFAQLMPGTAGDLGVDPRDPWQNLDGGARYLAQQLNRFGRIDLGLAAYNAGPGNVQRYGGIPPFEETQNYVRRINQYYNEYLSIITGAEVTGTLAGATGASAEWGNLADASIGYGAYMNGQIEAGMTRILALLRDGQPRTPKEAVDHNTYMLAERARLMALTLRLRAAHVTVEAAGGLAEAAEQLQQTDFWEYRND
jgi:hypothetical protein